MKLPVIAIVGRPNVGKSSLLNALVGRRVSIVEDVPGVTRDRVATPLQLDGRWVELVDTGGYGFDDPDLREHIRHQIELAMARADLVVFIVDIQTGLTPADEEVASRLRRKGIKAVLVGNKADSEKADAALGEFARLGLGTPIGVSALTGRNIDLLRRTLVGSIDLSSAPTQIPEPEMLVAIVGKRNAGKSTLVNAVAQIYEGDLDRVIVSEVPGTTRDSIDVRFEKDGKALVVIDTAGVRKKRHMVTHDIEFYSFHRAQRSVRRADVVLLLIDATEPISDPDRKLAQYIDEQRKPVVLVVNKWDLAKEIIRENRKLGADVEERDIMEEYREYIDAEVRHLDYAPIAFITARDGKNVQVVLDLAQHLYKQASTRVTTGQLNQIVRQLLEERHPSTPSGRRARVYYVTQTEVNPPTIVLFVNKAEYFDENYQRFLINRFRETLPFAEVPMKLVIRPRDAGTPADRELDPAPPRPQPKRPGKARPVAPRPARSQRPRSRKPAKRRPRP